MSFHTIYTDVPNGGYIDHFDGTTTTGSLMAKPGEKVSMFVITEVDYDIESVTIVTKGNHIVPCPPSFSVAMTTVFSFEMPDDDIKITLKFRKIKEDYVMEPKTKKVIDHFEIPEELATELSDLLTRQTIRERLLSANTGDPVKFKELEDMLVPITSKIEAIKMRITSEFVPEQYRDERYSWNYDGWEVAKNTVQVLG